MGKIALKTNPEVASIFDNYPASVREKMMYLRKLILEAADETPEVTQVEETLKWGEPSYLAKKGSTIRIDWKPKQPGQYAMYFQCTSRLVPTFRMVFKDLFTYEGNRAIVFQMEEALPEAELKSCITAGLTYHRVKQLPTLGL